MWKDDLIQAMAWREVLHDKHSLQGGFWSTFLPMSLSGSLKPKRGFLDGSWVGTRCCKTDPSESALSGPITLQSSSYSAVILLTLLTVGVRILSTAIQ